MLWIFSAYAGMSLLALTLYGWDKRRAITGGRRVPERTLHLLELLGGWPGALLAQHLFHHKRRKLPFMVLFWTIVLLHLLFWLWWALAR